MKMHVPFLPHMIFVEELRKEIDKRSGFQVAAYEHVLHSGLRMIRSSSVHGLLAHELEELVGHAGHRDDCERDHQHHSEASKDRVSSAHKFLKNKLHSLIKITLSCQGIAVPNGCRKDRQLTLYPRSRQSKWSPR